MKISFFSNLLSLLLTPYNITTRCLKKYCQCFVQGHDCHGNCACQNCQNNSGMGQGLRGNNTVSNQEQVSMYAKFKALDDSESTASSTNSTNFEALDALVEVKMSSAENTTAIKDHLKESPNIKTVRKPRDPEGFKHNLPFICTTSNDT